jgi:hypothetical protein
MSIEQELVQLIISIKLQQLYKYDNKHMMYEYLNCLERWLLSMAMCSRGKAFS